MTIPTLALAILWALQGAKQFDVAVIRLSSQPASAGTRVGFDDDLMRISNEPVRLLLRIAFQAQDAQISGGPDWVNTDRYDIQAKIEGKVAEGERSALVRELLLERFQLKFHRETRELNVLALVPAKGGAKVKASPPDGDVHMNTSGGKPVTRATAAAQSMQSLAGYVGNRLGKIVIDKTGLDGRYDFTLEWSPDTDSAATADSAAPSLVTALREQLGFRLETQKAPVEVLVIDHIERPTAN